MVRWLCKVCGAVVLGPARAALDHVCRVCFDCSQAKGQTRLVMRVAVAAERKREKKMAAVKAARAAERDRKHAQAEKAAQEKAEREAARATAMLDERARKVEAARATNEAARRSSWEYIIVPKGAETRDATCEIFDGEQFGEAWARYKSLTGARLMKLFEDGWLMSAIRGYVVTRPAGDKFGKKKLHKDSLYGWNRVEPEYRGELYWRTQTHERQWLYPGQTVIANETTPIEIKDNRIVKNPNAKQRQFAISVYDDEQR